MVLSAGQKKLLNTEQSFWVDASAGSGKTFVLVERILALIVAGVAPRHILMLTFTKTAAHEVVARVHKRIQERAEKSPFWQNVFQTILEQGGVNAQTLHSFCYGLWQRFCVERGWGYACRLGADEEQREVLDSAIHQAFACLDPWKKRCILGQMSFVMAQRMIKKLLNYHAIYGLDVVMPQRHPVCSLQDIWRGIPRQDLEAMTRVRSTTTRTAAHMVSVISRICAHQTFSREGCLAYAGLFVTAQGEQRVRVCPKELAVFQDILEREAQRVTHLLAHIRLWEDTKISCAMHDFMLQAQTLYARHKKQRGLGDYDDIIHEARAVLKEKKNAFLRTYVAQNIEHILVDEAQDTSMVQWDILCVLVHIVSEAWPHARVFIVGDYKQSIYGFQGVRAHVTKTVQALLQEKLPQMHVASMDTSYRCAPAIIDVVNAVGTALAWPTHRAERRTQGHVIVRRVLRVVDPQERAAEIAAIVEGVLRGGVFLPSRQRNAQPQDILLLTKQRDEVFRRMPEALATKGIPCFGVDRAHALDYPLIEAVMALMDVLLLPEDDVAFLKVLQGPWFGWTLEAVHTMLLQRTTTLWSALRESSLAHAKDVVGFVLCARAWVCEGLVPFFYWFFYVKRHVTQATFGDVGKDAFMQICEEFDMHDGTGLAAFMRYMRMHNPVIKSVAAENVEGVRLLSVHGAKGLEAPVVIVLDADRPLREEKVPWMLDDDQRLQVSSQGALWKRRTFLHESTKDENNRLLYVALTRAQDVLCMVGCGGDDNESWLTKVRDVVDEEKTLEDLYSVQAKAWCAPPTRVAEPPCVRMPCSDRVIVGSEKARRSYGRAMHLVLSSLIKDGPDEVWAKRMVHQTFDARDQASALEVLQECMRSEAFAQLRGYHSVEVECTLQAVLNGTVSVGRPDYIGRRDDEVLIVDFKTSSFEGGFSEEVVAQLALYAELARAVYHDVWIKTAVFLISQAKLCFFS